MPEPETIEEVIERINSANDNYHEAINEVMQAEFIPVEVKTAVGARANELFRYMSGITDILNGLIE